MTSWMKEEMTCLNDPVALATTCLKFLENHNVGAVMFIGKSPGKDPCLAIATLLTITPLNEADENSGAPFWRKLLRTWYATLLLI